MHKLFAGLLFNQGYVADPALARALDGAAGPATPDAQGDRVAIREPAPAATARRPGRLRTTLAMLLPGRGH